MGEQSELCTYKLFNNILNKLQIIFVQSQKPPSIILVVS